MICGIYKIGFVGCQEFYIGQSKSFKSRFKEHKNKLRSRSHHNERMQQACNKYGLENIRIEIIEICQPEELNEREVYYIALYNSYYYGFNKTLGGVLIGTKSERAIYLKNKYGKKAETIL